MHRAVRLLCPFAIVAYLPAPAPAQVTSQMLGWIPIKRPGSLGVFLSDFDHTGFFLTRSATYPPGRPPLPPTTDPPYYKSISSAPTVPFGGPANAIFSTMQMTGSATYKWEWKPAPYPALNNAPQIPNFQDFPAPALFVLGKVDISGATTPMGPPAGLAGSGTINDGWNAPVPFPLFASASLNSRKVLSAGAGNTTQVSLSPSAEFQGTGTPRPRAELPSSAWT